LIKIGSKTAEKNFTNKQTKKQTDRHYENNGHLAVNQKRISPSIHVAEKSHADVHNKNCIWAENPTSSSAIAERPRDARVTWIRKIV